MAFALPEKCKFPGYNDLYAAFKKELPDKHDEIIQAAALLFKERSLSLLEASLWVGYWAQKNTLLINPLGNSMPSVFISAETGGRIQAVLGRYFENQ